MKEKIIAQIELLEKAQTEAFNTCRLELIVGLSEMIFRCLEQLETYK